MHYNAGDTTPEAYKGRAALPPAVAAESGSIGVSGSQRPSLPATHDKVVLFDKPFLLLTFDVPNQWVHAQWRGCLTLEVVREGSEKVLELVRAHRYRRLLNDNTAVTHLDLTEEEQRGYQIMDLLFDAGLHYLAWVYAPIPQGGSYADNSIATTKWPLILSFEEVGPASEWLRQVQQGN